MKNLFRILIFSGLFGLIILFVYPSKFEKILLDSNCKAPCWRDIKLGDNQENVEALLSNMDDIDQNKTNIYLSNREVNTEIIEFNFNDSYNYWSFNLQNDKVSGTDFNVAGTNFRLFSAIKIFGKPDWVIIRKLRLDNVFYENYLIYDNGICLKFLNGGVFIDSKTQLVHPFSSIDEIFFFNKIDYESDNQICSSLFDDNVKNILNSWRGYKVYPVIQ